ncbi:hypothetical protein P3342_005623 [Pyrenophora teres f. teres]|nr:hypothetical protein HRS9139_00470 [Pyrenophora teres f. teres]KAE8848041.1 hypothetical protein PTNB85_01884 [Pyrenophora teres f. teres]KAE8853796.1 hypothetical protein HRS9122_00788 [Pyrenophora teres f. teres]KAE8867966.1 hypothetical protein PTNB29_01877 [Pyrenophora teres f. teres]KAE8872733.1 hypothetical protein PTNB73_01884 [Pyrenophora teres f. teres]
MSLAEANRQYFDSISSTYDSKPWFTKVNTQVADFLRAELPWIGIPFVNTGSRADEATGEVRLLDYACGTGLMTRVFAPYVTSVVGIDLSPKMISEYTTRAAQSSSNHPTITATNGDLFDKSNPSPPALSSPQYFNFDIATVGFGFHHFEDVVYAAGQLKQRLRPGGVLVINDFLEGGDVLVDEGGNMVEGSEGVHAVHSHNHGHGHDHGHGHHHGHGHGHKHADADADAETTHDTDDTSPALHKKMSASIVVQHFTVDGVRKFFTEAGFVDVDVVALKDKSYMEFGGKKMYRTILFAKGRRPVAEKSEL